MSGPKVLNSIPSSQTIDDIHRKLLGFDFSEFLGLREKTKTLKRILEKSRVSEMHICLVAPSGSRDNYLL